MDKAVEDKERELVQRYQTSPGRFALLAALGKGLTPNPPPSLPPPPTAFNHLMPPPPNMQQPPLSNPAMMDNSIILQRAMNAWRPGPHKPFQGVGPWENERALSSLQNQQPPQPAYLGPGTPGGLPYQQGYGSD